MFGRSRRRRRFTILYAAGSGTSSRTIHLGRTDVPTLTAPSITSSWARRGGVNLQPEVVPQQTERPPHGSPLEDTPDRVSGVESNIQADRPHCASWEWEAESP